MKAVQPCFYYLAKTEPEEFAWADLVRKKRAVWDGVRNFQARNFMQQMRVGDRVFIYHTGSEKAVVGVAEVVRAAYPDPTFKGTPNPWVVIEVAPVQALQNPITLEAMKRWPAAVVADFLLLKQARLSVMPVPERVVGELVGGG